MLKTAGNSQMKKLKTRGNSAMASAAVTFDSFLVSADTYGNVNATNRNDSASHTYVNIAKKS